MSESALSISYDELAREAGHFLGFGRDPDTWDNTQLQDFEDVLKRGLRLFYYPPSDGDTPYYEWTFLRKTGTITLVTADYDYTLPDDFGGTILDKSVTFPVASGYRGLSKISESSIRQHQSYDNQSGVPKYYAVRNRTHTPTTGQRWELLCYPTPAAIVNTVVLTYRYVQLPGTLSNTNLYPLGGAQYSEVVLAAVLAAAEYKEDDEPGGPFAAKFEKMLGTAMRNDKQQKQNDRGGAA